MPEKRIVNLNLWSDGAAKNLPAITVTGGGLRLEGTASEFDRLYLVLKGWIKQ